MTMESQAVKERMILEIALAADVPNVKALLSPVFGVTEDQIVDLRADAAGEPAVRYDVEALPGSFPTKLTVYVDPDRAHGVTTDDALAKALVAATNDRAVTSLPPDHPKAEIPTAWMLYRPGQFPRIVHEKPRDDDGIDV